MGLEHITGDDFEKYRGLVRQWNSKKDAFTVACMATIMAIPATAVLYAKEDYFAAVIMGGITILGAYGAIRARQRYQNAHRAVRGLEQHLGYLEQSPARPIETPGI